MNDEECRGRDNDYAGGIQDALDVIEKEADRMPAIYERSFLVVSRHELYMWRAAVVEKIKKLLPRRETR